MLHGPTTTTARPPGRRRAASTLLSALLLLIATTAPAGGLGIPADDGSRPTLLRDALVVDGSGDPPFRGDVLVTDGRVVAVGEAGGIQAPEEAEVVDLRGLALAPGFVDIHNHSTQGLLEDPQATTQIAQGITTLVVGADGSSPWPPEEYLDEVEAAAPAVDVALMVGHGTVRRQVLGEEFRRTATGAELERMRGLVTRAMEHGAFGLSSGLEYDPGFYASTGELIGVAEVAARHGGFYMSHVRDEEEGVMDAIREAIRIGEEASLPVQISHIKMGNSSVWGRSAEALELIRAARERGVDVTADWYPYEAWASSLSIVVRSREFDDPEAVADGLEALGGADRLLITGYDADPSLEGMDLAEIAASKDRTPVEQYMRMIDRGGGRVIGHTMSTDDVERFAASPLVMVSSDGGIGSAHPRGAGTFPRVLGRYVRERGLLSLEEAVRKMTAMPAERLGLDDRGRIREGARADLVAFDPDRVVDRSTFAEPGLLPAGIERVWLGGELVWSGDEPTGRRPGRILRRD